LHRYFSAVKASAIRKAHQAGAIENGFDTSNECAKADMHKF
jgi:hypothetical protein